MGWKLSCGTESSTCRELPKAVASASPHRGTPPDDACRLRRTLFADPEDEADPEGEEADPEDPEDAEPEPEDAEPEAEDEDEDEEAETGERGERTRRARASTNGCAYVAGVKHQRTR